MNRVIEVRHAGRTGRSYIRSVPSDKEPIDDESEDIIRDLVRRLRSLPPSQRDRVFHACYSSAN